MSDKAKWRVSAWLAAGIITVLYLTIVGLDVPHNVESPVGYRMGFFIGYMACCFVPTWLARVIYNRIPKEQ